MDPKPSDNRPPEFWALDMLGLNEHSEEAARDQAILKMLQEQSFTPDKNRQAALIMLLRGQSVGRAVQTLKLTDGEYANIKMQLADLRSKFWTLNVFERQERIDRLNVVTEKYPLFQRQLESFRNAQLVAAIKPATPEGEKLRTLSSEWLLNSPTEFAAKSRAWFEADVHQNRILLGTIKNDDPELIESLPGLKQFITPDDSALKEEIEIPNREKVLGKARQNPSQQKQSSSSNSDGGSGRSGSFMIFVLMLFLMRGCLALNSGSTSRSPDPSNTQWKPTIIQPKDSTPYWIKKPNETDAAYEKRMQAQDSLLKNLRDIKAKKP